MVKLCSACIQHWTDLQLSRLGHPNWDSTQVCRLPALYQDSVWLPWASAGEQQKGSMAMLHFWPIKPGFFKSEAWSLRTSLSSLHKFYYATVRHDDPGFVLTDPSLGLSNLFSSVKESESPFPWLIVRHKWDRPYNAFGTEPGTQYEFNKCYFLHVAPAEDEGWMRTIWMRKTRCLFNRDRVRNQRTDYKLGAPIYVT